MVCPIDFRHATGAYQKYGPSYSGCANSLFYIYSKMSSHGTLWTNTKSDLGHWNHLSKRTSICHIKQNLFPFTPTPVFPPWPSAARHWYASKHAIARNARRSHSPHFHTCDKSTHHSPIYHRLSFHSSQSTSARFNAISPMNSRIKSK